MLCLFELGSKKVVLSAMDMGKLIHSRRGWGFRGRLRKHNISRNTCLGFGAVLKKREKEMEAAFGLSY